VYLDGGVSTGADVFKAIALGANMVIRAGYVGTCEYSSDKGFLCLKIKRYSQEGRFSGG